MTYEELEIGQSAMASRVYSESDLEAFALLSLDKNPLHFDEEFAKGTFFKKRIVHGFLYSSLISGVLGTQLPGPGAIYLQQEMKFSNPVFIGEEVIATVKVLEKIARMKLVVLETTCSKLDGTIVLTGKATVKC